MEKYTDVPAAIAALRPEKPLPIFREHAVTKAATFFLENFRGKVLFAVKTNPEPLVLRVLRDAGVTHYDVASLNEVKLVRETLGEEAKLHFMHTVKSRRTIREAYFTYGVRHFSLDSVEELDKILEETEYAEDLALYVRIGMPNTYAELNLADKFGIGTGEAVFLLRKVRQYAEKLGVCFHVGSQTMHPNAYRMAMKMAADVVEKAGVPLDMFDVGGGFPSVYPGMTPPPLSDFMDAIHEQFDAMSFAKNCELMCEPGRALVAEAGSTVVRVDLRRGQHLYINDGTYGSLFDAGVPGFIYPVRLIRPHGHGSMNVLPFSFYGPTCDSMDFMKGPFYLPEDMREGDYIEIGQLGAYSRILATGFNGFGEFEPLVAVNEAPMMTMYDEDAMQPALMAAVA